MLKREELEKLIKKACKTTKKIRKTAGRPFVPLICLGILAVTAAGDFLIKGTARRTIVFCQEESGLPVVEERYVPLMRDNKDNIRFYIGEVLLGPESFNSEPLLGKGTRLETFIYHDENLLLGFSEEAFDALAGEERIKMILGSIADDLQRNFPDVKGVRFFVAGCEVPLARALPDEALTRLTGVLTSFYYLV